MEKLHEVWMFALLILSGGLLGGLANYFLNRNEPGWKKGDFYKSLVLGIAASASVPLILQIVQSNLMENCTRENWIVSRFVFFGFCTIVAIFSTRFLTSIADNLLRRLDKVEQKQEVEAEKTKTVVEGISEPKATNTGALESNHGDDGGLESTGKSIAMLVPEEKLIQTLDKSKYIFRTVQGMAKDSGMEVSSVETMLLSMEKRGMVKKMQRDSDGETLWMLSR